MANPPVGPEQGRDYRKGPGHHLNPPKKNPPKKGPVDLGPPGTYTPPNKATGERAYFLAFMKAHPVMQKYADPIWHAAGRWGSITPTELAAVLFAESGGNPSIPSKKGALGLAQIYDNSANATNAAGIPFFRPNLVITDKDKLNPKFAIQYAAWRLSGQKSMHPDTIDNVWIDGYNPHYREEKGYNKHYISQYLPKGYPGIGGTTAGDTAGRAADVQSQEALRKNPYVSGVKSGKLLTTTDLAKAVSYDGAPMQLSDWSALSRHLDSYFVSYTGGRPSNQTVLNYVKHQWSEYQLTIALSKGKNFKNSPIYKKYKPVYDEALKNVLAPGETVLSLKGNDKNKTPLINSAIVNGWDPSTFAAVARKRPQYVQSNEFKGNASALLNVHASIMGNPDAKSMNAIKQAALAGWDANQYAAYVRSQPEYVQSPEYQSKTLSFLDAIGLITGQNPVLKKGHADVTMNPNPGGFGPLPTDKRLPKGDLTNAEDTVATYGR